MTGVHVNPVDNNYFVSASADGSVCVCVCVCARTQCVCFSSCLISVSFLLSSTVRVWDLRCMSKKNALQRLRAGRMVSSAYFSPLTGCRLLMTSLDNTVRCRPCDSHVIIDITIDTLLYMYILSSPALTFDLSYLGCLRAVQSAPLCSSYQLSPTTHRLDDG